MTGAEVKLFHGNISYIAKMCPPRGSCPLCGSGLHLVCDDGMRALVVGGDGGPLGIEMRMRCDKHCSRYGVVLLTDAALLATLDVDGTVDKAKLLKLVTSEIDGVAARLATPDDQALLQVGACVTVALAGGAAARHAVVTMVDTTNPAAVSLTLALEPSG